MKPVNCLDYSLEIMDISTERCLMTIRLNNYSSNSRKHEIQVIKEVLKPLLGLLLIQQ